MNFTKKVATMTAIAAATLMVAQAASAQEFVNPDWANRATYIGAAIGQSRANFEDQSIIKSFQVPPLRTVNSWSSDERDIGYKLFIGKQMSRNFAVEASFFDLGDFTFNTTTAQGGNFGGKIGYKGLSLDLLGIMPFSERFALYGRLGAAYVKSSHDFKGDALAQQQLGKFDGNDNKVGAKFGVGLEYKFTEALALRAEVERNKVTDRIRANGNGDLYSLALVYKLGRPVAAPYVAPAPVAAPAPAPVAQPAPMPAPAPAPVPVSEKVSFAAEALFDFDKSIVKPEGKAALDDLLNKLQGMNTEVMVTVGHTDSIGSNEYNQRLSLRRAEAVKAYIVSKGVDQSRVYTEGKGETQPVADNKTAEGRAKNRRVTVEVVGTRTVTK